MSRFCSLVVMARGRRYGGHVSDNQRTLSFLISTIPGLRKDHLFPMVQHDSNPFQSYLGLFGPKTHMDLAFFDLRQKNTLFFYKKFKFTCLFVTILQSIAPHFELYVHRMMEYNIVRPSGGYSGILQPF